MLSGGSNYNVPVPGAGGSVGQDNVLAGFEDDLSRTIVDLEVNADQWTLMHRYNKAAELIEQVLQVRHPPSFEITPTRKRGRVLCPESIQRQRVDLLWTGCKGSNRNTL